MISRRGLFSLFGGVAAAPLVKALPAAAEPATVYEWTKLEQPIASISQLMADNVTRNNAILSRLIEKRLFADKGEAAAEDTYEWDGDPDGGW